MKILAPLRNFEQIEIYSDAGADEFYFGFDDNEWTCSYGDNLDLNRMSALKDKANSFRLCDISDVVSDIHERGLKCYLTLNSNIYSSSQVEYIRKILNELEKKPYGVIFSDIQLIDVISEAGIMPVASTMCAIYNTDIARFYKDRGVKRIILPRELSLNEISSFIENEKEVEFEAFLMRDGCMFSDSNCLGVHRENFGGVCSFIRKNDYSIIGENSADELEKMKYRHFLYTDAMVSNACGLCAIYRLLNMNIAAVKIVGRADRTEEVMKDITYVRDNIEIAKACSSEQEYLDRMIVPDRWKMVCGMSCYYPELQKNRVL